MARKDETKGYQGQVAYQLQALAKYQKLQALEQHVIDGSNDETYITRMKIRAPRHEGDEWFIIINAEREGVDLVAFHSGDGLVETLVGIGNRVRNGSLKFREDRPYDG